MYIAQIIAAGELIVIEVLISPTGRPSSRISMSARLADRHAAGAELALGHRVVVVVAVQGRHVVRDREPGATRRDQLLEAVVGVLGRAEAGEHAHRPQPAPVAGGMDAAREGRLTGQAQVVDLVPAGRRRHPTG